MKTRVVFLASVIFCCTPSYLAYGGTDLTSMGRASLSVSTSSVSASSVSDFTLERLGEFKRALALKVLPILMSGEGLSVVRSLIPPNGESLSLHTVLRQIELRQSDDAVSAARRYASDLDGAIRRAKGLERFTSELLEIRLEPPSTLSSFVQGAQPLLTYVPGGEEDTWTGIEAFDANGISYELDPRFAPDFPVLVVGINEGEDLRAGMAALHELMIIPDVAGIHLQRENSLTPSGTDYFHKVTSIYLVDDKEPWTSGSAEVYALPSGVDPAASEAEVSAVDMPYLDNSTTTYNPNQLVISWKYYRYSAANLHLYEHDDSTSLQTIASTLISSIGYVYPEYAAIAAVGSEIVSLMPADWWANDDDYVDVYYTLEKSKNYSSYYGASKNAKISLSLYALAY